LHLFGKATRLTARSLAARLAQGASSMKAVTAHDALGLDGLRGTLSQDLDEVWDAALIRYESGTSFRIAWW
jgi:hypothetical protein